MCEERPHYGGFTSSPEQVVWYVEGKPFQLVDYPYTVRWPLAPGEHRFQVRFPHTEIVSNDVTVWIQ